MTRYSEERTTDILETAQNETESSGPIQSTRKTSKPKSRYLLGMAAAISGLGAAGILTAKATVWLGALLLGSFLSTMAAGQRASMPLASTESAANAAILHAAETYRKGVLKGDAAAVTSLFRDDAVEMGPFQQTIVGHEALARFYEGAFRSPVKVTEFQFTHRDTSIHGDVAYDVGSYKRTMTTPGGTVEAEGSYAVILKENGGQWQIAYLIYNCNCTAPDQSPSTPR